MTSCPYRIKSFDAAGDVCNGLMNQVGDHILDKELAKRQTSFVRKAIQRPAVYLGGSVPQDKS